MTDDIIGARDRYGQLSPEEEAARDERVRQLIDEAAAEDKRLREWRDGAIANNRWLREQSEARSLPRSKPTRPTFTVIDGGRIG